MKASYKIPYGLNKGLLDTEINTETFGFKVFGSFTFSVRSFFIWIGVIFSCLYFVSHGFIQNGNIIHKFIFIILYLLFFGLICSRDNIKRLKLYSIPLIFNYFKKSNRVVHTRKRNPLLGLKILSNIDKINVDGSVDLYTGEKAFFYDIEGSASTMLFESDREAIIKAVERFFIMLDPKIELIFVKANQSQDSYEQIYNLKKKHSQLTVKDADLEQLFSDHYYILKDYVGDHYKSNRQYLAVICKDREILRRANDFLINAVAENAFVLKKLNRLDKKEVTDFIAYINSY